MVLLFELDDRSVLLYILHVWMMLYYIWRKCCCCCCCLPCCSVSHFFDTCLGFGYTVCVSMDFAYFSALIPASEDLKHHCDPKLSLNLYPPQFATKFDQIYWPLFLFLTFSIFFQNLTILISMAVGSQIRLY